MGFNLLAYFPFHVSLRPKLSNPSRSFLILILLVRAKEETSSATVQLGKTLTVALPTYNLVDQHT